MKTSFVGLVPFLLLPTLRRDEPNTLIPDPFLYFALSHSHDVVLFFTVPEACLFFIGG
jgi:hypothetical protein